MAAVGDLISGGVRYPLGSASDANLTVGEFYVPIAGSIRVVIGSTSLNAYVNVDQVRSGAWVRVLNYYGKTGGTYDLYKGTPSTYFPVWCIFKATSSLGNAAVTWYTYGYGYTNYLIRCCGAVTGYTRYTSKPSAGGYGTSYPYRVGSVITAGYAAALTA